MASLGGALTLGLVGAGTPLHASRLVDDAVWVFGFDHGHGVAHHVDLSSGTVDVRQALPSTYGAGTRLVQAGDVTYVADNGRVQTLDLSDAEQAVSVASVQLPSRSLYPVEDESGSSAWFLDPAAGKAIPVDVNSSGQPVTGPAVALGGAVDTSSSQSPAGVDRDGRLWVALAGAGSVVAVAPTKNAPAQSRGAAVTASVASRVPVAAQGESVGVSVVSGQAYAVDSTAGKMVRLGGGSGPSVVPLPRGAIVSPRQGTLTDPRATTVLALAKAPSGDPEIVSVDLQTGKQVKTVVLRGDSASQVLPPYPVGDRAVVVNTHTAQASIINLDSGVVSHQSVAKPGDPIQVEARNGLLAVSSPTDPSGIVVNDQGVTTFQLTNPPKPKSTPKPKQPKPKQPKPQPTPQPSPNPQPPAGQGPGGGSHVIPVPAKPTPKPGPPGPPGHVSATGGKESATLTWTPPAQVGAGISGYEIQGDNGAPSQQVGPGATSVVIHNLTDGTAYQFKVRTDDKAGQHSAWVPAPAVTPESQVPGTPQNVTVGSSDVGDQQVTVHWDPVDANGTTVTKYAVYWTETDPSTSQSTGGQQDVTNAAATSAVVTGLTNGDQVTFQVQTFATYSGRQLTSDKSAPTAAVTPYGKPGVPQVTLQRQDGSFVVGWTVDPNGSAVTGVAVDVETGNGVPPGSNVTQASTPGASGSQQISGTNGTTYTVYVSATNQRGTGAASAAQTVTPAGAPVVTLSNAGQAGDRAVSAVVSVNWNGSQPGSCHLVAQNVTDTTGSCNATITITGLMYNTTYTLYAYAVSTDEGNSQNSNSQTAQTNLWSSSIYDTYNGSAKMYNCSNYGCGTAGTIASGTAVQVQCWARGANYTYYDNNQAQATFNLWIKLSDGRWTFEVELRDSSYNNQPNGSLPQC